MTDSLTRRPGPTLALALLLAMAPVLCPPAAAQGRDSVRSGDYIAAVVNQELVTAGEVQSARRARADEAAAAGCGCRPRASCAARCSTR